MQCNCTGHKFTFRSSLGFSSFLHNYKVTLLTRTISLTSYRCLLHRKKGAYHTDGTFSRNLLSSHGCYLLWFRHQSLSTRNTKQNKPTLFTSKILRSKKVAGLAGLRKPRPEILALCFRTTKTKTLVHIPFKLEKQFKTVLLNKN